MIGLYRNLVKHGDAIAVGFSVLMSVLFALSVYFGAKSGGYELSTLTERADKSDVNCFNLGLWIMYILAIVAIMLMIFGVLWDLFRNFKSGSKTIIGFGGVILVFIILFFTSSHDTNGRYAAYWSHPDFHINETISKFISAGLYTMMGMALVSFVLIILFEVRALFK
jgi:hypothetical protein